MLEIELKQLFKCRNKNNTEKVIFLQYILLKLKTVKFIELTID